MTKTDNAALDAKLTIRRRMLSKYQGQGMPWKVLDCCAGSREIWKVLTREYACQYTGLDLKRRPGVLRMDSRRFLREAKEICYDVIDIDTYGLPWKHYQLLCEKVSHACIVFLTVGQRMIGGGGRADTVAMQELGIKPSWPIPNTLGALAHEKYLNICLAMPYRYGMVLTEVIESTVMVRATRYYAVRMEPET